MNARRRPPALFLGSILLLLVAACSHGGGESNTRNGDVRVKLTADTLSTATTTTSAAHASSTPVGMSGSTTVLAEDGDGDGTDILSKLEHVNVTISSLLARNLDGDLINLVIDLPKTVDLIGLMNGQQVTLPTGTLPPGMYDQLVVVIKNVEFVFLDGTKVELTPPGGGWTKIVPVTPFEVIEGQTTTIELRFKPFGSFREFDGEFEFFPDFDCRSDS
jgi:uncharacterized protein DUF4382